MWRYRAARDCPVGQSDRSGAVRKAFISRCNFSQSNPIAKVQSNSVINAISFARPDDGENGGGDRQPAQNKQSELSSFPRCDSLRGANCSGLSNDGLMLCLASSSRAGR